MQNLSADNSESVEFIVNTYGDFLYRICYILLKNKSDAEDAVEETFIKYIQKKPKFNDCDHIRAWLITVAKNKCKDMLKYRQSHLHSDIDDVKEEPAENYESDVLDVLMTLPEKFRLVLVLFYIEGYKTEEIARMVKKTPSAVKMRLQKGRILLKEKYKKEVRSDE